LNEVLFKSECLETVTNDRNGEITGWVITHFILYFILGMVAPSQFSVWFTIGTLWELLEYLSGYIYKISGFKDKDQTFNDRWWCGSINDIIVNLFGLILGIFVNYFFNFLKKEKVFS
jgi:VanZ family protein